MTDSNEAKDFNQTILEQSKLLCEASEVLTCVLHNFYGLIDEVSKLGHETAIRNRKDFENQQETIELSRKLIEYVDQVHLEIPALADSMKKSEAKVKDYQQKLDYMKTELEKSENLLTEAVQKRDDEEKEASSHSQYTAAMGSTMGSMLWKTSKSQETIDTFISTDTLNEFIIMSNITMNSFMESYSAELPLLESHEHKFAMSIVGTNINISAHISGRNFILADKIGITFIHNMLEHLGSFLMPSGRLLKRMSLIFLYNISICKRGAMLIQMSKNGVENILKCLGAENTTEIQTLALTLMTSLLEEIPTEEFCQQVMKHTLRKDLKRLMTDDDANLNHVCKKFHSKLCELEASSST